MITKIDALIPIHVDLLVNFVNNFSIIFSQIEEDDYKVSLYQRIVGKLLIDGMTLV